MIEISTDGDIQVITAKSKTIRTLAGALKSAKVDLKIWDVERHTINKWDVTAKLKNSKLAVAENWQVKIWLKRKLPKPITDALDELYKRQKNWKPFVCKKRPSITKGRHMLELDLFDAHFGKLAWGLETGTDYDLKSSKLVYGHAADDLMQRASGYNIERILIPVGNDFFHVNNWLNTTAKGTQQDVDTRFQKIFEVGCEALIRLIEQCLQHAPVDLLWVPGNHDPETSWYLIKYLDAWYRNITDVRVNKEPEWRKYVGYGVNLLGFTHGNEEPERDLPTLMATERPEMWAASTYREWHLGHYHKKKETKYNAGDTYGGVGVRVIPSLSGTDAWHYRKGYVKGIRAAEAYLWSHDDGYVGHFNANVRLK